MNEKNLNQIPPPPKRASSFSRALLIAIALILIAVLGFHLLMPILGITLAVSMAAWGAIIATIVFFCIAALLFFIVPAVLIIALSLLALFWVVVAVILFPILFPVIVPVFIILLFIGYARRKRA